MGAVPKKKVTRARQGARASHFGLAGPAFSRCPRCSSPRRPHRACPVCGFYRDRQVLEVEES